MKIAQVKGEYDAERMKVIYSGMFFPPRWTHYSDMVPRLNLALFFSLAIGKILQDDKTVESYNIQEKDFLVCLPSKVCDFHCIVFL